MCSLIQVLFTLLRYNKNALDWILLHRHAVNRRDGDLVVVKTDWDCISDFSQGAEQRSAISNPKNNSTMFCTKHLFQQKRYPIHMAQYISVDHALCRGHNTA